ncbi:ribosome maturation factor RimM, partial [bacterium]|nr:ribosome maturation factor RimM [bacterium]
MRKNSEAADPDENLIEIGTITKPVGLRGELKIFTLTKSPSDISHYTSLYVWQSGVLQKLTIEKMRVKGNIAIVKFVGIDSIDRAEEFLNSEIFVDPDQLPATESDEYFIRDLLGMEVFDEDGD